MQARMSLEVLISREAAVANCALERLLRRRRLVGILNGHCGKARAAPLPLGLYTFRHWECRRADGIKGVGKVPYEGRR